MTSAATHRTIAARGRTGGRQRLLAGLVFKASGCVSEREVQPSGVHAEIQGLLRLPPRWRATLYKRDDGSILPWATRRFEYFFYPNATSRFATAVAKLSMRKLNRPRYP